MTRRRAVFGVIAAWLAAVAVGPLAGPAPGSADADPNGYASAAQASAVQWTYDFPGAPFHPLAESEGGWAATTLDATRGTATAASAWPGSAGANFGSLVGVLGGPTITSLNEPVEAEASTGAGAPAQTLGAPPGPVMHAAASPGSSEADATAGATPMGPMGSVGASRTRSAITLAGGVLSATASSSASDVGVGGVVTVGSMVSSATGTSTDGATPVMRGSTVFHDVRIAGEPAYVDGSGVHVGTASGPSSAETVGAVNATLANAGMAIYFTKPATVAIGGVAYYYAASVLVYWQPPGDSNHDTFSVSLGGAAVSMAVTPGSLTGGVPPQAIASAGDGPTGAGSAGDGSAGAAPLGVGSGAPAPAAPSLDLGTPPPGARNVVIPPAGPVSRPLVVAPASVAPPTGGGVAGWLLFIGLAAVAGAAGLPRLLAAATDPAAGRCPWEERQ